MNSRDSKISKEKEKELELKDKLKKSQKQKKIKKYSRVLEHDEYDKYYEQ